MLSVFTSSQFLKNQVNGDSCALYNRFTEQDVRIGTNVFFQVHNRCISLIKIQNERILNPVLLKPVCFRYYWFMKITRYGVILERLTTAHIEMVRQWRNDTKIAGFMFYKGEITRQMQSDWFASVDNEQNFFFIIHYKNKPVGLINISSIDWENKTAYTGLFIYDDVCLGTDVPVSASLAMLDVFFMLFNVQMVYAKVKGNNRVAHNYNTALGFTRTKKIELGLGFEYMLQKEIYLLEAKGLRNSAIHLKGNNTLIELDKNNPVDVWVRERIKKANKSVLKNLEVKIT